MKPLPRLEIYDDDTYDKGNNNNDFIIFHKNQKNKQRKQKNTKKARKQTKKHKKRHTKTNKHFLTLF